MDKLRYNSKITFWIIIFLFLIIGCQKRQIPRISKKSAVPAKTKEQLENQEVNSLLNELKQKNPFRPDHAMGLAIEIQAGNDLKGIIWDSERPFAIIGNSVVAEGEYIDNKKVLKINKRFVILDNNGKEEVLRLEEVTQ